MKKLLSFLAAGAIALGLIGCSGDLHDTVDPATIPLSIALQSAPRLSAGGVPGAMNGWDNTTKWTSSDDTKCTYVYEFKATAETLEWKAITTAGNWNSGAWGGGDNEALTVPIGTKTALVYDGATGGKKNCSTTGFKVGKMYSITLNYENGVYNATVAALDKEAPVPFYLDGFYFLGNFNTDGWNAKTSNLLYGATTDTQSGEVTYTIDFVCNAALETGKTAYEFGVASLKKGTTNWETKYTGAAVAAGAADFTELTLGAEKNNTLTGLKVGATYRATVKTTPAKKILVKVVEVPVNIVWKVKIKNLPTAAKGKTVVLGGSWNWDLGWTSCWGGTKKVSDLPSGVVDSTGAVTVTVPGTFKYDKNSVKTIEFCGYYGTPTDGDIKKADGEIKIGGNNITVTTPALDEDTVMLITVDMAADTATVAKCPPLATIEVSGLPDDANGKVVYLTGEYNGWKTPGQDGTIAATIANNTLKVVDADIKLSTSAETSFNGKFAAAGWSLPEVCGGKNDNAEAENIQIKFPAGKTTLKGKYVKTVDNGKYICTWTVE